MKHRRTWSITGVLTGIVLLSVFFIFERTPALKSFSYLIIAAMPVILGVVGFFSGAFADGIFKKNESLNNRISDIQKEKMDQALNLSAEINSVMDELRTYSEQQEIIVNNINSAICFIDKDFRIELGYNDKFISIFGDREYEGNSIVNTIFNILDNETKSSISDYLELCFSSKTASAAMLNDANPVRSFEYVHVIGGTIHRLMINTSINVIKDKDMEIEKIMFIFDDVTAESQLKKELTDKDREYSKRYSIMVSLFSNDKTVIQRFIGDLEEDMVNLSDGIKRIRQNENNPDVIIDILGMVHSIKGEAFALGFKDLSEIAEEFEALFKKIKDEVIGLESNLEIISFFEKLNNEKREFDKTIHALQDFLSSEKSDEQDPSVISSSLDLSASIDKHLQHEKVSFDLLRKELDLITEKTASEMEKKSFFTLNTTIEGLDGKRYKIIKEVFLHMIRNSIAHGIESPLDRLAAGKPEDGSIVLAIGKNKDGIVFFYTDDGRGFNLEKIKAKAVEDGMVSEHSVSKMADMDIIKLIFRDGFSTSDSRNMVSGTGIGMSVIKGHVLKELKGKLSLTSKPGKGIRVRITIPE